MRTSMAKEWTYAIRSGRLVVLLGSFLFLAISTPLMYKFVLHRHDAVQGLALHGLELLGLDVERGGRQPQRQGEPGSQEGGAAGARCRCLFHLSSLEVGSGEWRPGQKAVER